MIHPRDLLLRRHATATPHLDEMRHRVLAGLGPRSASHPTAPAPDAPWYRLWTDFLGFGPGISTAMGLAALLALSLEFAARRQLNPGSAQAQSATTRIVAAGSTPILALVDTLRERGRLLQELEGHSSHEAAGTPTAVPAKAPQSRPGTRSQAPGPSPTRGMA